MKHTSLNCEINHLSLGLFIPTSPLLHGTKISLKRFATAIHCRTFHRIPSNEADISNSLPQTICFELFSNSGDGPH